MGQDGDRRIRLLLRVAAAAATVAGWWTFWFLTDDAFIAFRYASNQVAGRGLVWNPAPFLPVEGYTSFLWTILLAGIWRLTGLQPPETANALSLGCALLTLWLVGDLVERLPWPGRTRTPVLAATLLATVTNRTFLAWTSSGLETALLDLEITGWLHAAMVGGRRRVLALAAWAVLAALTRPDGLLLVAGTLALVAVERVDRRQLAPLSLLALVGVHLAWRRWTYGWWLPNTFYAKVTSPWPEAGARYLLAFALEYGLVVLPLALAAWALSPSRWRPSRGTLVAAAVMALHLGYYTLVAGGDHFEFRVYAWLVPLLPVALAAALAHHRAMVPVLFAWILLSWPIPWVHWWASQSHVTRKDTYVMVIPIAQRFPAIVRPYVALWDAEEAWLVPHHVGMRHQEHKVFLLTLQATLPARADGERVPWEPGHHVRAEGACGAIAWALPNVAILDTFGLSDPVIAHRARPRDTGFRRLAHELAPPPGYVECFEPDTDWPGRIPAFTPRKRPLTDERIRRCQERFAP